METENEKKKKRAYIDSYMESHQVKRLFHAAKQRAKKSGLEFTIEEADIVIPPMCPYLAVPITNVYGAGRIETNASLDRMDSSKGYIKGNVQVISDLANKMKSSATPAQLMTFAQNVLHIHQ